MSECKECKQLRATIADARRTLADRELWTRPDAPPRDWTLADEVADVLGGLRGELDAYEHTHFGLRGEIEKLETECERMEVERDEAIKREKETWATYCAALQDYENATTECERLEGQLGDVEELVRKKDAVIHDSMVIHTDECGKLRGLLERLGTLAKSIHEMAAADLKAGTCEMLHMIEAEAGDMVRLADPTKGESDNED